MRWSIFGEIVSMAWSTVSENKMRSALTVLGIVIGITSIVGMTSLIKGFDESLRDTIRTIGPETIYVVKFSALSLSSGAKFQDLSMRPNLTPADADAIQRDAPDIDIADVILGQGPGAAQSAQITYRDFKTKQLQIFGTTARYPDVAMLALDQGRFFNSAEVQHHKHVVVLGQTAYQALFAGQDAVDKLVRVGAEQYTVVGVAAKRPSPGGLGGGQDDFVIVPETTYQTQFGIRAFTIGKGENRAVMIAVLPRDGVTHEKALAEVENVMRIRHGLHLDQPDDFDLLTQDAILQLWDQISQATFLALIVISSIALMVGGIGVMSIMMMAVTERTREIGVRKAIGARRTEILWQFLFEAVFLTSLGGLLGIICGGSIGYSVHWLTGFPVFMPWWSFALGIGFSAGVGIFFGMMPAVRASRLDPIEALRYE